jgi:hypothetical protein
MLMPIPLHLLCRVSLASFFAYSTDSWLRWSGRVDVAQPLMRRWLHEEQPEQIEKLGQWISLPSFITLK